ncbi:MAG: type II toxin-antitoxin system RelE/ParE family toxin [Candidatus Nealsonbacteria bacterium CG_4_9_14_3_um_filter_37_13]|uniref:Type II toxin-antitoxin system RelE/ParE family toxin n=2 Tax=Candidatus Nealsoniibacteriota TaxID=1817911 RepID=A0A2H0TIS4_9BACT|nr:MAG: type II toxin-antitoxin system RelE/ParE family toxin [Candidatus Nealsonbacteria bacterium CG10_big_fil_rev_8_21_14_0_10_37_25]PJA84755.1 MAG: type II toxin-antitoxin system RelE/ParE family toxin [Candidatus Nealsonbacteria bacterium CG_4_9_14_3_um_filter_37_13]
MPLGWVKRAFDSPWPESFMKIRIFDVSLEKFIKGLQKPTIAKVLRIIDLLEKFGQKLGPPHAKKISAHLFELRVPGKQEVRIFYSFHKSRIFLLHGFIKKSRKIPRKEIKIASQKLKLLDRV